jgi:hypothetical protein
LGAKFQARTDEDRAMLIAGLVRPTAQMLLDEQGEVAPLALVLSREEATPLTYFPRDAYPDATWQELFDRAVEWARLEGPKDQVVGVAVVSGLTSESEPQMAIGAQVETATGSMFLFFPCRFDGKGYRVGEFQVLEDLLVPEGVRWKRPN